MPANSTDSYFSDIDGIARFDNITIRSDSINEQRFDKVMPLWPEEHLVTASILKALDLKGKTVLDIGCGSGVFSILCAKHGAKVVAVDCSARAISATMSNARLNGISINKSKRPSSGKILLHHELISNANLETVSLIDGYDVVLITPPYNPGFKFVSPAAHAAAGSDGQMAFNALVGPAIELLSPAGVFVCNHMSTVDSSGNANAYHVIKKQIQSNFGREGYIETRNCFKKARIDIREFLDAQYRSTRKALEWKDRKLDNQLQLYINELANKYSAFELATYVASPTVNVRDLKTSPRILSAHAALASRNWSDRKQLHARIVETAIPNSLYQLPAFSGNTSRYGGVLPENIDNQTEDASRNKIRERIGLDLAGVRSDGKQYKNKLDLVIIDAAPIADYVFGQAELRNEVTIWMSNRLLKRIDVDFRAIYNLIINRWQSNTRTQQEIKVGPFLHPWFTGAMSGSEWSLFQSSTRLTSTDTSTQDAMKSEDSVFEAWSGSLETAPSSNEKVIQANIQGRTGYYGQTLGSLKVDEPVTYLSEIFLHARLDVLWRQMLEKDFVEESDRHILDTLKQKTQGFLTSSSEVSSIQDLFSKDSRELAITSNLLRQDAQYCHSYMHKNVESFLLPLLSDTASITWSSLQGMPLRIRKLSDRRENGLPTQYRGGVWTFCASIEEDGLGENDELQRQSFDISKSVWLNYIDRFGLESATSLVEKMQHDSHHQITDAVELLEQLTNQKNPNIDHLRMTTYLVKILFVIHSIVSGSLSDEWETDISIDNFIDLALLSASYKFVRLSDKQHGPGAEKHRQFFDAFEPVRFKFKGDAMKLSEILRDQVNISEINIPENWKALRKEPRFAVMFYSGLRQAFFHGLYYTFVTGNKGSIIVSFDDKGGSLHMKISNSGITPVNAIASKDERILKNYAAQLRGISSFGPRPDENNSSIWTVTTSFLNGAN